MEKHLLALICVVFTNFSFAQDWAWLRGNSTTSVVSSYGTMGISSPANDPGSRHGAAAWTDNSGNLWQFGGEGYANTAVMGWLNDLWKYNPATNEWTWVKGPNVTNIAGQYGTIGVPSPTNNPGAREFPSCWKDNSGNFWLFGGDGWDALGNFGRLNDLWKYNISTNEWTWIKGSNLANPNGTYGTIGVSAPGNNPGGRHGGGAWTDGAGNLWLIGGYGFPASGTDGHLNDLWRYNLTTNEWTWIRGNNTINVNGTYGPKGVAAPANNPGGREFPAIWKDPAANAVWMFGGGGYGSSGGPGHLNDLWRYNPGGNVWTYVAGTDLLNQLGIYGAKGVPSNTVAPGGRYSMTTLVDNWGNLWMFGGIGYSGSPMIGRLNDLFRYTPATNEWTWMKGNNGVNTYGVYGTMGIPAPANNPGSRYYNYGWRDLNGDLWTFGCFGYSSAGPLYNMNDLWKYKIVCSPSNSNDTAAVFLCSGNSTTLSVGTISTSIVNWYSSPTSTTSIGTGTALTVGPLTTGTYTYYAEGTPCTMRVPITITVNPLPTLSVASTTSLLCTGNSATLTASGANNYSWSTSALTATIVISPTINTTYTVFGTDVNGCADSTSFTQNVSGCVGINSFSNSLEITLYPNPSNGTIIIQSTIDEVQLTIYNMVGQKVLETELKDGKNLVDLELSKGVYFYSVKEKERSLKSDKLIVE